MGQKILVSSNQIEAEKKRFTKYFRFNNSKYWLNYYAKKLSKKDIYREKLYAKIIAHYVGKNSKILDVASGIGFLLKELEKQKLSPTGLDLFDEMINAAGKYLNKKSITIIKSDILSPPFKPNSLDCISMVSIIEHFPFNEIKEDILPTYNKILKRGGYLFVHVPVKTFFSHLTRLYRKNISHNLPSWAIDDDGDITHSVWLTQKEYVNMIENAGFQLINFDSNLTRSNQKPEVFFKLMKFVEKIFSHSDRVLKRDYVFESIKVKMAKNIKLNLALTSYMLFIKV